MGRRPVWKAERQNGAAAGKTVCKCGGPKKYKFYRRGPRGPERTRWLCRSLMLCCSIWTAPLSIRDVWPYRGRTAPAPVFGPAAAQQHGPAFAAGTGGAGGGNIPGAVSNTWPGWLCPLCRCAADAAGPAGSGVCGVCGHIETLPGGTARAAPFWAGTGI